MAAVRLGRWGRGDGGQRDRQRRTGAGAALVVAALTVAGSVVLTGAPAGSAERDGRRFRDRSAQSDRSGRPSDRDAERRVRRRNADDTRTRTPARFVAELKGRIAIVSANTGRVERYLTADQPGRGARQPTVSDDGRTVWFSRRDGTCAAHLASVAITGGRESKLPGSGEAGPEGLPLPRPGRAQIAYARADCDDRHTALIIGDVEGLEGHGQMGLVPMAWNRRGDHLLAVTPDGQELRLLDINETGSIVAIHGLAAADPGPGCRLAVIGFSPDENDGYMAVRLCGSGREARRSLVLLRKDGTLRRTVVRLPRGQKFADHVTFDETGHSLLYSTTPSEAAAGRTDELSLWVWRDGETRRLARHSPYRHPSWVP